MKMANQVSDMVPHSLRRPPTPCSRYASGSKLRPAEVRDCCKSLLCLKGEHHIFYPSDLSDQAWAILEPLNPGQDTQARDRQRHPSPELPVVEGFRPLPKSEPWPDWAEPALTSTRLPGHIWPWYAG